MFNGSLFEQGFDLIPDQINADADNDITGDWVSLKDKDRAYLCLSKPAGTAGDDLSIKLNQATDNSGSGSKALNFTKIWHKIGTMNAVTQWTHVELTTATDDLALDSVNGADLETDESAAVVLVEVMADSLDVDGGFDHVQVFYEGDDVGNALLITSFWIMTGNAYAKAIPNSAL